MANMPGVDCSNAISGAALAAVGKEFVGRYVTNIAPSTNPKEPKPPEIVDLHAHGIGILLFGEDGNADLTSGVDNAVARTKGFIAQCQGLGVPADNTVGLALADDENSAPDAVGIAAMHACAPLLRSAGLFAGYYGRKSVARALQADGTVQVVVVVDTWGQDQPGDRWNFRQLPNSGQVTIGGVACDIDDAPFPEGLWLPTAAPVPAPTPAPLPTITLIKGDPDVSGHADFVITTDANGAGAQVVGIDSDSVISVLVESFDPQKAGTYFHFEGLGITAESVGIAKFEIGSSSVKNASIGCRAWFTTGT